MTWSDFLADCAALVGALAIDVPLDGEQGVDLANHLEGDGRDHDGLLAFRLAPSGRLKVGVDKERSAGVGPTSRLLNGARLTIGRIELAVAAERVRLENSGPRGEMGLRMIAAAIAGVIEHRRRRPRAAERLIVEDVNPTSGDIGLALGENRDGGVVPVETFGG